MTANDDGARAQPPAGSPSHVRKLVIGLFLLAGIPAMFAKGCQDGSSDVVFTTSTDVELEADRTEFVYGAEDEVVLRATYPVGVTPSSFTFVQLEGPPCAISTRGPGEARVRVSALQADVDQRLRFELRATLVGVDVSARVVVWARRRQGPTVAEGHAAIVLRDRDGRPLAEGTTTPYSPRATCGGCHDVDALARGFHFEEGRTDESGAIAMKADFFGTREPFVLSPGMYGNWCPCSADSSQLAPKTNASESELDKTSFYWVLACGICHPGGGPGERDRDGQPYFDPATGQFGYERLGRTAAEARLDGDYALLNPQTGAFGPAPWNVTGVVEPDCLQCHRTDRTLVDGRDQAWAWRIATLRGSAALVDSQGLTVPAFTAAPTAGQGWFSLLELAPAPAGATPAAARLQIDYGQGLRSGSLRRAPDGTLLVSAAAISRTPRDASCRGCHTTPDGAKRGRTWFVPAEDVHYAAFNGLTDATTANDVPPAESVACTRCHVGLAGHDVAKGRSFDGQVANWSDYEGLRSCRGCHTEGDPRRDPAATPYDLRSEIHRPMHLGTLSCEACHVPYRTTAAAVVMDNAVTGTTVQYMTSAFYSADPLDPDAPDTSRWYPDLAWKVDEDGLPRLFPLKPLLSVWWGDWDQAGTPADRSDDVVRPIPLWRVRQITGNAPLPVVTDDDHDGRPEVNRIDEIAAYFQALKGVDSFGNQVAARPVFLKGERLWFEDPDAPGGIGWLALEGSGLPTHTTHPFGVAHNVLPVEAALGAAGDCADCHRGSGHGEGDGDPGFTPVFGRWILVDPFGEDGQPVYERVSERTGVDPGGTGGAH